jgi:phosphotransferase system enzyme I (PtsI)
MMLRLRGIAAAPGVVIGPAYKIGKEEFIIPKHPIKENEIPLQIQLFEEALIQTRKELLDLQDKLSKEIGKDTAQIFDAHLLALEDRTLIEEVLLRIKKERFNVAYIFSEVIKKYIKVFSNIEDEYLRERVSDINDVGRRILRNILGKELRYLENLQEPVVIVAYDLSPSETAMMHKKNVCAFVTDIGGKTSHTAIMAKSLEIPAVVGIEGASLRIESGDTVIVDGFMGIVVVNPDRKTLDAYRRQVQKFRLISRKLVAIKKLPAQTRDGKKVEISANIELPQELQAVKQYGAFGIGLYRTEFFYMNRKDLPSEEEHYLAYKHVAQQMNPYPVVIRTLDLGGDKFISQLKMPKEMSPFLGWRAIRFCLAKPNIFKVQLRAILRASVHGNLKIMYPMISGVEELRQANSILREVKEELRRKKIPFRADIEVGAMIELPSAAMTADLLAQQSDFFSIGTNDLIQYSLAVDRTNEKVAYLYEPAHPALLRMIRNIIEAGHNVGIWVGMCGEMSGEPALALILLGLGLDEFSMSPMAVPEVKYMIRSVTSDYAQQVAREALCLSTGREVEEYSHLKLRQILK